MFLRECRGRREGAMACWRAGLPKKRIPESQACRKQRIIPRRILLSAEAGEGTVDGIVQQGANDYARELMWKEGNERYREVKAKHKSVDRIG